MCDTVRSVGGGRYRLEKKIGRGGFGTTYKAMDTRVNVWVAVKEFQGKSEEDTERALAEARITAEFYSLDGIAAARDFFEENGAAYIVMEYVHGISIKKYIAKHGRMSGETVLKKLQPLMNSLGKIHEKGIIHRDISADNLMITDEGKLMLVDFGAAKFTEQMTGQTQTLIFKRGFAPIEQCRENGKQGTWTDVYSLCATIYFMITGIVPEDAIERLIEDTILPIGQIYGTGLSQSQERAIMKGLAVESEKRYATVRELYEELYNCEFNENAEKLELHTEQIHTQKGNTTELKNGIRELFQEEKMFHTKFSHRRKLAAFLTAFVLMAVVVAAVRFMSDRSENLSVSQERIATNGAVVLTQEPTSTPTPTPTQKPTKKPTAEPTQKPKSKKKATATPKPTATATQKKKASSTKKPKNSVTFDGSL